MSYYAEFKPHSGNVFRWDARIYLKELPCNSADGQCVASVIGKNPGLAESHSSDNWGKLELSGDKLLPTVRNIFLAAYERSGKRIPFQAFVQIWNLFYLCNHKLSEAIKSIKGVSPQECPTEQCVPNIVWFAWGNGNRDQRLNSFKQRFQNKKFSNPFFYDKSKESVSTSIPSFQILQNIRRDYSKSR
jgi:hypothetical protein